MKARKVSADFYAEFSCNKPAVGVDLSNAGLIRLLDRSAKVNGLGFRSGTLIQSINLPCICNVPMSEKETDDSFYTSPKHFE